VAVYVVTFAATVAVVGVVNALLVEYWILKPVSLLELSVQVTVMVSLVEVRRTAATAVPEGAVGGAGTLALAVLLHTEMPAPFDAYTR